MRDGKNDVIVSIDEFGAKAGEKELQTASIQAAIDFCFGKGGGEVMIPAGEYLTGGIRLRSNTTLHLSEGAKLIGSRNPADYFILGKDTVEPVPANILTEETRVNGRSVDGIHFGRRWFNSLIKIYKAENVRIIGESGSVIDGQDCYDEHGEEGFRGPHCISVSESTNIIFEGYTVQNSANWGHCIWNSKNIRCEKVTIKGGHDGFDVFGCENVIVRDCNISSGDDCIAGYANYKVLIKDCKLSSSCSAFRFGGTKVKITGCRVNGNSEYVHRYTLNEEEKKTGILLSDEENPNHRYRMKSFYTYYADNRLEIKRKPSDITIEDCEIINAEKFLHYNFSGSETWQKNRPLYEIGFKNVTAKGVSLSSVAYGDEREPLRIKFLNVSVEVSDDYRDDCLIRAANLKKTVFDGFKVKNFNGDTVIRNYGKIANKAVVKNSVFGSDKIVLTQNSETEFAVDSI